MGTARCRSVETTRAKTIQHGPLAAKKRRINPERNADSLEQDNGKARKENRQAIKTLETKVS